MSENTPVATDLSSGGETFANDYHWRSTKAKQQLRDRFGRWISMGANVKFRADGMEKAGVVTSVVDGKAYVDQKNDDGTVTQRIILPSDLRVIASKAKLPKDSTKVSAPDNSFSTALNSPEFKKLLADNGQATIQRADGYALEANLVDKAQGMDNVVQDGTSTGKTSNGNPIAYQLFAPGGRSLGQYTEAAADQFDSMVAEDKGDVPATDTSEQPAEASPAPVAAAVEVSGEEKPYRVPEAVRGEISAALKSLSSLSPSDLAVATRLASDPTVSISDVKWIHEFFCDIEGPEKVHGGYKGRKWASKIVDPETGIEEDLVPDPRYSEIGSLTYAYYAIGEMVGSTVVARLIAVDYDTASVFEWTNDGFILLADMLPEDVEAPAIIPIDESSALELAKWLDTVPETEQGYDILDTDPEERNLFTMATPEIDFEELDRASEAILAAAGDGVYTPVERSQNAKVQRRGAGGRFGSGSSSDDASTDSGPAPVKKATLPVELPLVPDVKARINEWLSTAAEAPVVAAGEFPGYTSEDQAAEDAATGPTDEAIYFAIVDEVDKTAVLDAVAIVKQNGQPSAFVRSGGQWVASPDYLAKLQGAAPPPVAELPDPATVKTVLEQIDQHDAGSADGQSEVADDQAPKPGEVPIAASAFGLSDGSYTIIDVDDLKEAVTASAGTADIHVKSHIRKRAHALNRLDLVPSEWRAFSLAEIGELEEDASSLYGPYGEIITASGVPGIADTPKDFKNVARLKHYWKYGKGALKIRWGTPGDLTRAHRHLAKYVGPERAWGLAQNLHKEIFGVSNIKMDKATGQYKPHRRHKR